MGTNLSTPKTEKSSDDGENDHLGYGLSSMQGWRASMEDAHAAHLDLDASTSFFGVYDGHGENINTNALQLIIQKRGTFAEINFLLALVIPARERGDYKRNRVLFWNQKYVMDAELTPKFSGKVVAKFCAKYLHQQVVKSEAYIAGDIGTSLRESFFRMDEMMRGQRGWRELAILGDKFNKFNGKIEGLIWSPRSREYKTQEDSWAFEEGPHSNFAGPTSGSTACVAIIRNNQLFVANAGDSRCVICRKGQAYDLSIDHKPDVESEKERIIKAGGFIHAGRVNGSLSLARAIGDMEFKQNRFLPAEKQMVTANPDINTIELCDEDEFIVLACDGIWDCLSSQQLVDFVRQQLLIETKLSAVCERVLDRCLSPTIAIGDGCDNMTMILVQFKKLAQFSAPTQEQSSSNEQVTFI